MKYVSTRMYYGSGRGSVGPVLLQAREHAGQRSSSRVRVVRVGCAVGAEQRAPHAQARGRDGAVRVGGRVTEAVPRKYVYVKRKRS